jgi:hypothetical protein
VTPLEADPSLVARIGEWFWAVVWNWKGLVAGLSLASGFTPQLLPERGREWLDRKLRPESRQRVLIGVCICFLIISIFQVYDDASAKLRHVSSQLPDFDKVTTWSVSFEMIGLYNGMVSPDNTFPSFVAFQRCRFVNLAATRKRILDVKIEIPTNDPEIPVVTLDSESMQFQEYRKSLMDKGVAVDEGALGRKQSLLETPIQLEPGQLVQGTIEFDIHDGKVKQKILSLPPTHYFTWWRVADAIVSVKEQLSDMTRTAKLGYSYNAITGKTEKVSEHYLLR